MNLDTYGLRRTSLPETGGWDQGAVAFSSRDVFIVSAAVSHTPFPGQADLTSDSIISWQQSANLRELLPD